MVLNKNNKESDAIADLYRASYYLAKGSKDVGIMFLLEAKKKLGDRITLDIGKIVKLGRSENSFDCRYWAEKALDEHKRLKMNLS
jgi:hypothetical protein